MISGQNDALKSIGLTVTISKSPCLAKQTTSRMFPVVKPSFLRYNYFVRLDLFLKVSRLVKRRSVAREMCDSGRALVNGHESKPAKEVKPGDVITLKFSSRAIDVEVLGVLAAPSRKTPPEELYQVKSETRLPKDKDVWRENLSSS